MLQEIQNGPVTGSSAVAAAAATTTTATQIGSSFNVGGAQHLAAASCGLKTSSPPMGMTLTDYSPPLGHADVVSDLTMVQGSQNYIVSASKEGVVKVWK